MLSRGFDRGEYVIVGAVYNLSTGKVDLIDETVLSLPRFADAVAAMHAATDPATKEMVPAPIAPAPNATPANSRKRGQ